MADSAELSAIQRARRRAMPAGQPDAPSPAALAGEGDDSESVTAAVRSKLEQRRRDMRVALQQQQQQQQQQQLVPEEAQDESAAVRDSQESQDLPPGQEGAQTATPSPVGSTPEPAVYQPQDPIVAMREKLRSRRIAEKKSEPDRSLRTSLRAQRLSESEPRAPRPTSPQGGPSLAQGYGPSAAPLSPQRQSVADRLAERRARRGQQDSTGLPAPDGPEQEQHTLLEYGAEPERRLKGLRRGGQTRFDNPAASDTAPALPADGVASPPPHSDLAAPGGSSAAAHRLRRRTHLAEDLSPAARALEFFTSTSLKANAYDFREITDSIEKARSDLLPLSASPRQAELSATTELMGNVKDEVIEIKSDEELDEIYGADHLGQVIEGGALYREVYTLTQPPQSEYTPPRQLQTLQAGLFFHPQRTPVPEEKKVKNERQLRSFEEEGFFVGDPPAVSQRRINAAEHRVVVGEEDPHLWFGPDGRLIAIPNPLRPVPQRAPGGGDDRVSSFAEFVPAARVDPHQPLIQDDEFSFTDDRAFDSQQPSAKSPSIEMKTISSGRHGGTQSYELVVHVSGLQFSSHPLFSEEVMLASELQALCIDETLRRKRKTAEFLSEKLLTLRSAAARLKVQIVEEERLDSTGALFALDGREQVALRSQNRRRLSDYRHEIQETRELRDQEMRADLALARSIVGVWNRLKACRQRQEFVSTSLSLTVYKREMVEADDRAAFIRDVEDEVEELRDIYKEKQHHQQQAYLEKKARRYHDMGELEEQHIDGVDLEHVPASLRVPFDQEAARLKVAEKLRQCRRPFGQPELLFELRRSEHITADDECPQEERKRRAQIEAYRCNVRVLVNGKEVSKTRDSPLAIETFAVNVGETFPILVSHWPESIVLQVWEKAGLGIIRRDAHLADLHVPIPGPSTVSKSIQPEDLHFSSEHRVRVTVNEATGEPMFRVMTGVLKCSVGWGSTADDQARCPPKPQSADMEAESLKRLNALASLGAAGMVDPKKLEAWVSRAGLDPNDPRNTPLLHAIKATTRTTQLSQEGDFFRIADVEPLEVMTFGDAPVSKRERLLRLRHDQVPEFRNIPVPLTEGEINPDIFSHLDNPKDHAEPMIENILDFRKSHLAEFLSEIRNEQMRLIRSHQQRVTYAEVVDEEALPDVGTIGKYLKEAFAPRRPLQPKRRVRKLAASTPDECNILVRVVRAFNVPTRAQSTPDASRLAAGGTSTHHHSLPLHPLLGSRPGSPLHGGAAPDLRVGGILGGAGPQRSTDLNPGAGLLAHERIVGAAPMDLGTVVSPFVEVVFQQRKATTQVGQGVDPSWNEELKLPFHPPHNDFSPDNLQRCSDEIFFNLFDEVIVDVLQDDRQRATNIHHRREKRWLGTFALPISTVYMNQRVEGSFKVDVPIVLFGYNRATHASGGHTSLLLLPALGGALPQAEVVQDTYLSIFVTLEPPLRVIPPGILRLHSDEEQRLLRYSRFWVDLLSTKFPTRSFMATTQDIKGMTVFITRYIRDQTPPESLLGGATPDGVQLSMRRVARFVSLIPFLMDSVAFVGNADLWTTSDQFLQLLAGDQEEHAVLLCNYMLALGVKAWVVLGKGVPEGETAYVLTYHDDEYLLWNPLTGLRYDPYDHFCPLTRVSCVFNGENIWANTQAFDTPSRMSWDFRRPKFWKPFFDKRFPNPELTSVQVGILHYVPTDEGKVQELQEALEKLIMRKIEEWRERFVTKWNRYCSQQLRGLLETFEEAVVRSKAPEGVAATIDKILETRRMIGFPLNMAFSNAEKVVDAVYNTSVHLSEDPEVEFSLAMKIVPYPNNIFSVWIYVATLTPKS